MFRFEGDVFLLGTAILAPVPVQICEAGERSQGGTADAAAGDPELVRKMEEGGFDPIDVPYSEMKAFMDERKADYEAVAASIGITSN